VRSLSNDATKTLFLGELFILLGTLFII